MKNILVISIWPTVFLLSSCSTISGQTYFYNEIVVRNSTFSSVQDVVIRVDKTRRVFRCSNIAPRASCSNSFKPRTYQKNPIKITWVYDDRRRVKREFVLEVPQNKDSTRPLRGVLEIKQDGSIRTYFEQD